LRPTPRSSEERTIGYAYGRWPAIPARSNCSEWAKGVFG
jgi:hypothetical protein